MPNPVTLLWCVGLPLLLAVLGTWATRGLLPAALRPFGASLVIALAATLGMAAFDLAERMPMPELPPVNLRHWTLWIGLALVLPVAAVTVGYARWWLRVPGALVLPFVLVAGVMLMYRGLAAHSGLNAHGLFLLAWPWGLAGLAIAMAHALIVAVVRPPLGMFALAGTAGIAAITALESGTLALGHYAAALAAALGGVALIGAWRLPRIPLDAPPGPGQPRADPEVPVPMRGVGGPQAAATVMIASSIGAALLTSVQLTNNVPIPISVLLALAAAPLGLLIALLPGLRRLPLFGGALSLVAVLAIAGAGFLLLKLGQPPPQPSMY